MMRVLVVDDEAAIRDLVGVMLEEEGYEIMSARNGEEALQLLADARADLLLTDWMMPVMDGGTLLQNLAQHPQGEGMAVIVMSAAAAPELPAARVAAFLAKPFDLARLLKTVKEVLEPSGA